MIIFENFFQASENFKLFAKKLFEDAFIEEERYPFDEIYNRDKNKFEFLIVLEDNIPIGIISFFNFKDFIYCEHFAIDETKRNKGYGKSIFNLFLNKFKNKQIVLEVELPTTLLSCKRINFYKKLGFYLNKYEYWQPSYRKNELIIQMYIMSILRINNIQFDKIKNIVYYNVYKYIF